MTRLLLTGASGFIGRQAVGLLATAESDSEIHAVARGCPPWADSADQVIWHDADLLDPASIRTLMVEVRPTDLVHLAWYTDHGKFWSAPENLDWAAATLMLARTFAEIGGKRLTCAGTCAEYSWGNKICRERLTPLKPITVYGRAKLSTMELLEHFAVQADLSFAWVRLFLMFGPDEPENRLVPTIIRGLLSGQPVELTEGLQVRDFLHTRDIADGILAVARSGLEGPVNLGSGQPTTLRQVAHRLGSLIGREHLLHFGTRQGRPEDPDYLIPDLTHLHAETDWCPYFDLDSGLSDVVAWWKRRLPTVV